MSTVITKVVFDNVDVWPRIQTTLNATETQKGKLLTNMMVTTSATNSKVTHGGVMM